MDIKDIIRKSKSNRDEIWVNKFDEESAQEFREDLLDAAKGDPQRPIVIYIDSYGGLLDALAKMLATMDEVPNPLITVCMGKAMSCGAVLLSHGDIRFCDKYSRVMIHEASGGAGGDVHDVHADAQELKRVNTKFLGILANNCGIKGGYQGLREMIKNQDGRDCYLDAEAAVKFGIVDVVGVPKVDQQVVNSVTMLPEKKRVRKLGKIAQQAKTKAEAKQQKTKKAKTDSK